MISIPPIPRRYVPTRLWGFSGHVQTILHSIVGRVKCPWPLGERVYLSLSDGSTLTYDLYQPLNEHEGKIFEDYEIQFLYITQHTYGHFGVSIFQLLLRR